VLRVVPWSSRRPQSRVAVSVDEDDLVPGRKAFKTRDELLGLSQDQAGSLVSAFPLGSSLAKLLQQMEEQRKEEKQQMEEQRKEEKQQLNEQRKEEKQQLNEQRKEDKQQRKEQQQQLNGLYALVALQLVLTLTAAPSDSPLSATVQTFIRLLVRSS